VTQTDAATAYETLHVPALFGQWAPRLLGAAGVSPRQRVLDVACGTGILAREAVGRVGPGGTVTGLDPDPGMLAVAAKLAPEARWCRGTAEALPWTDGVFDVVASQFGLMFFPDRALAMQEMTRVLAPGGRLAVAVWDSLDNSEAYPEEVALLARLGGRAAADALRAPFVLGDTGALAGLFAGAGLTSISISTHVGTARFPSVRTMVEADLRGWLPVMGVRLEEETIRSILQEAEQALGRYVSPEGQVVFASPAHIVTGTRAESRGASPA